MGSRDCFYCLCQNLQPLILLLTNQIKSKQTKNQKQNQQQNIPQVWRPPAGHFLAVLQSVRHSRSPKDFGLNKKFLKNQGTWLFDENYLRLLRNITPLPEPVLIDLGFIWVVILQKPHVKKSPEPSFFLFILSLEKRILSLKSQIQSTPKVFIRKNISSTIIPILTNV